jgi:hypothetical protein
MHVVAAALGVVINEIEREVHPIIAEERLGSSSLTIDAGCAARPREPGEALRGRQPQPELVEPDGQDQ